MGLNSSCRIKPATPDYAVDMVPIEHDLAERCCCFVRAKQVQRCLQVDAGRYPFVSLGSITGFLSEEIFQDPSQVSWAASPLSRLEPLANRFADSRPATMAPCRLGARGCFPCGAFLCPLKFSAGSARKKPPEATRSCNLFPHGSP